MQLDRDAPYVQIIEHYRREIAAGRLADGDMLPSGREIAAQFGVSLATAAKVASGLQTLGLVVARPGAGTVVT
ncbi:MAG: GntR family transcriptional regulator, partial [Streptosporangiaceae bacterium]